MLTTAVAKAAGAQARAYKLADAGGLHLHVAPTGTKSWRLKYRFAGREKLLTIGRFPDVSLAEARARREEAKAALRDGRDPGSRDHVERARGMVTFEQLARRWIEHEKPAWSPAHAADVSASLARDVFPAIGALRADAIEPTELLNAVRQVEARGCIETARRLRQRLSAIFGFGIAEGEITRDPAEHLGRAMRKGRAARPHPALTRIEDCRALLAACEAVDVRPAIRLASRFLALTAVRLDAVRGMRWGEIEDLDGDEPVWRVPPARMKLAREKKDRPEFAHLVPLSAAAVAVLREALSIFATSNEAEKVDNGLVFRGRAKNSPIGEGALRELYQRAGFGGRHVPHGWRASFSTILNERLPDYRADIDRALAHSPKDKVEAAYNRAALLERRRRLFEQWGALLSN